MACRYDFAHRDGFRCPCEENKYDCCARCGRIDDSLNAMALDVCQPCEEQMKVA